MFYTFMFRFEQVCLLLSLFFLQLLLNFGFIILTWFLVSLLIIIQHNHHYHHHLLSIIIIRLFRTSLYITFVFSSASMKALFGISSGPVAFFLLSLDIALFNSFFVIYSIWGAFFNPSSISLFFRLISSVHFACSCFPFFLLWLGRGIQW